MLDAKVYSREGRLFKIFIGDSFKSSFNDKLYLYNVALRLNP